MNAAIAHPVEMLRTLYKSFKALSKSLPDRELQLFRSSSLPNSYTTLLGLRVL